MASTRTSPQNRQRVRTPAQDRHRLGVNLFLIAALASFLLSIGLWFNGSRDEGLFVGLWVPSILAAGAFWLSGVDKR